MRMEEVWRVEEEWGWSCGGVEEEWGVGGERVDTLIADTCD